MRRNLVLFGVLVTLLAILFQTNAIPGEKVTICKLLADKQKYDGKEVEVTGWVVMARQKVSRAGNPYTSLTIKEDGECAVRVFAWEHQPLKRGDEVRVTGRFAKVRKVGRYTFFDEIEALGIEKRK